MRKTLTVFVALGLLAAAPLAAQQYEVKPGPEHTFLKQAEGVWDATAKSMGGESKGELHCKMELNGLWLLELYKGEVAGKAFHGRGATSYDPAKKKFVNVWIDSMVTSPMRPPIASAANILASPSPITGMSSAPRISKRPGSWKWPMTKAS